MDFSFEMSQSFYSAPRSGSQIAAGASAGAGSPAQGAQGGPYACKQRSVNKYIQVNGTMIMAQHQIITYQPVQPTDVIWPAGVDQTNPLLARDVLLVTTESLIGEDSTVLWQIYV